MILVQQGAPLSAGLSVCCDIPNAPNSGAWTQPTAVKKSVNGGALAAAASVIASSSQPGTGPYVALLTLNAADLAAIGWTDLYLEDSGGNVVGVLRFEVVLSWPAAAFPKVNVGQVNGINITGSGTQVAPWGP